MFEYICVCVSVCIAYHWFALLCVVCDANVSKTSNRCYQVVRVFQLHPDVLKVLEALGVLQVPGAH